MCLVVNLFMYLQRMNNAGQNYDFKSDPQYSDTTGTNELTRSGGGKGGSSSEDQSGNSKSDFIMEDGSAAPRKRKPLTADEKSKQNRDRNRDHAKNTRLRKKAYVIKLKELVDELTEQKVNEEGEAQMLEEKLNEVHTKRKNIVRLFLKYRSSNMNDYNQW